jgi:hypothetical protein
MQTKTTFGPCSAVLSRRTALKVGAVLGAGGLAPLSGCAQSSGGGRTHTLTMWSWSGADILQSGFASIKKRNRNLRNVEFTTQLYANSVMCHSI